MLATGLTIVRGQSTVDEEVYRLVAKAGRDSMPRLRLEVIRSLWALYSRSKGWSTTKQVADKANRHKSTVKYHLEDLHALRLIERNTDDEEDQRRPYQWVPTADLVSMIERTGGLADET
jgi:DNA-binding MarR family transcriptional regulator